MHRFPETIGTKQDIDNILNDHPEYYKQLKAVLLRATNEPEKAKIVTDYDINPETGEMINIVEKEITRPNQQWKRWGFKNRDVLISKIATLNVNE